MSRYLFERVAATIIFRPAVIGVAISVCLIVPIYTTNAQSTVVQLPGQSLEAQVAERVSRTVSNRIPSDLSTAYLQAEVRLKQPTPPTWRNEMPMGELIRMMTSAGLRIKLDESARDNNLDEEARIRLSLHNASVSENLQFALKVFQCDIRITEEGTIELMSEDALLDTLDRATYHVRHLVRDYDQLEELMDLLQGTIDPDSWEANGGVGRMSTFQSSNGMMLTVTQTYRLQVEIRKQLVTLSQLGGGAAMTANYQAGSPSQSVQLPGEYLARRRDRYGMNLPGSGTTSGFGGGGGLGGGVF